MLRDPIEIHPSGIQLYLTGGRTYWESARVGTFFFYAGESIYGYTVEGGNGPAYVGLWRLLIGRRGEEKGQGPSPPPISHRRLPMYVSWTEFTKAYIWLSIRNKTLNYLHYRHRGLYQHELGATTRNLVKWFWILRRYLCSEIRNYPHLGTLGYSRVQKGTGGPTGTIEKLLMLICV